MILFWSRGEGHILCNLKWNLCHNLKISGFVNNHYYLSGIILPTAPLHPKRNKIKNRIEIKFYFLKLCTCKHHSRFPCEFQAADSSNVY